MASIINQSRYVVRVRRRADLKREFPHTKKAEALAYQSRLINLDELPAEIEQLSNQLLVRRPRRRGHPEQTIKAASFKEAEKIELNLAAQQSCRLFIDYTRARPVTTADLITRYINEERLTKECLKKRGRSCGAAACVAPRSPAPIPHATSGLLCGLSLNRAVRWLSSSPALHARLHDAGEVPLARRKSLHRCA
jgi:hypothetical protein